MTAPPVALSSLPPARGARSSPLGWMFGLAAAAAVTAVAVVLALLFAAALAVAALLAFAVVLLALAAAKVRGRPAHAALVSARWTPYASDAARP